MEKIPQNFYRVAIKALVLDDKKRFLLTREDSGKWELPGGGMDHGENYKQTLEREILEETGIRTTFIAENPSYFYTCPHTTWGWIANALYETKLESFDFTPSDECQEMRFFTIEEAKKEDLHKNIDVFLKHFDPKNHQ